METGGPEEVKFLKKNYFMTFRIIIEEFTNFVNANKIKKVAQKNIRVNYVAI